MKLHHLLLSISLLSILNLSAQNKNVAVKTFKKNIPTYDMGDDDPNAYFKDFKIEGLSYFREKRSTYPYSFQNDYKPTKQDVEYEIVRLENEHIYLDIIPQLRGRIQGAVDKRNGWDFLYYNNVIKPAEIAVRSAWLSGGLEYNHPGGHGYTQMNKISYDIRENADGSKTVIVAEIEPVRMMKWEYEITLRPEQLFFETKGRFMSIAPVKVPFVSSNNAAMHATDEMELIYPQETYATGHGNSNLKKWSEYSTDGTDWNWVKNIKHGLSAFVDGKGLTMDYWGVYSHEKDIDAGSVVVADHRTSPGKKYFTWGKSASGRQWDTFLSDKDGGYVELQHQAFNQKMNYDHGILEPLEVKEFSIFWYPIKNTSGFTKATKEIAVNFKKLNSKEFRLDFHHTMNLPKSVVTILKNGKKIKESEYDFKVGQVYNEKLALSAAAADILEIKIIDSNKKPYFEYISKIKSEKPVIHEVPKNDLKSLTIDQLITKAGSNYFDAYGTDADGCIEEVLSRDPNESRALRFKGATQVKRGQYEKAIKTLQQSFISGHLDGRARADFHIGYALIKLGDYDEAHGYLARSSRHREEMDNSLYYMAQGEVLQGNLHEALRRLQEVPFSYLTHPEIYNLATYVCRKLGFNDKAKEYLSTGLKRDPLNFVGYIENLEINGQTDAAIDKINFLFDRKDKLFLGSQNYVETAIFYMDIKDYDQAIKVLKIAEDNFSSKEKMYPMIAYYLGYCYNQTGDLKKGQAYYKKASETETEYVFPYRVNSISILEDVLKYNSNDAIAQMYLGDLFFHLRRHNEAIMHWEKAHKLDINNSRVTRNLAIGRHVTKMDDLDETITLLEKSFNNSDKSARIFSELEFLYLKKGDLEKIEKHYDANLNILYGKGKNALSASDFYTRIGRYDDALEVLKKTYFYAKEGQLGTPYRHERYQEALLGKGQILINEGEAKAAIKVLEAAYEYPEYLKEAKVNLPITTRTDYLVGLAYQKDKQVGKANSHFKKAINQEINPVSIATIYKAKSLKEIGKTEEADKMIEGLIGQLQNINSEQSKNKGAINDYVLSSAYDYLGDEKKASDHMKAALQKDFNVAYSAMYASAFLNSKKHTID
ncbi:DUF5107 domain-containing protein [Kriegella sp. EG-1]|nr:DUF5107 domain-containing protein [Flavobacteriaceae bacterium EG-1]